MTKNYQATSNPYSADNLAPHDTSLRFNRDYGTNRTEDVGDEYNGSGIAEPNPVARIDARLGMLELNSFNMSEADQNFGPRGQTFLGPDLSEFPVTSIGGTEANIAVVYAKTLLRREGFIQFPEDPWGAGFVIGPAELVGADPTRELLSCDTFFSAEPAGPNDARDRASIQVRVWEDGGGDDPDICGEVIERMTQTVYWRLAIFEDPEEKLGSSITVEWSADGLTWQMICLSATLPDAVRRFGLVTYGPCIASLDWVRFYSYQVTAINDWVSEPPFPEVGGRLFVG